MSEPLRYDSRDPESRPVGLRLLAPELTQLQYLHRELLTPRAGESSGQWRQSLLRRVRDLTSSDSAVLVVRTGTRPSSYGVEVGPELLVRYVDQFAGLDRSRVAVRNYGLEVWSLDQLWPDGALKRSSYYHFFAVPNRFHATVGITLHLGPQVEVCLLCHNANPDDQSAIDRRRALLSLLLEPVRAGFALDLGRSEASSELASVMEVTSQALALFGMDGRELTRNPVMRRLLAQDQDNKTLQAEVRAVAKSVLAGLANRARRERVHPQPDASRREVATSQAAYRLRGKVVGNPTGHGTAVLVAIDRVAFQVPAPDSVRARYGLTLRELQVASLLMNRLSNKEIARVLGISPHTARHHTESVMSKVGARSREALRRVLSEKR